MYRNLLYLTTAARLEEVVFTLSTDSGRCPLAFFLILLKIWYTMTFLSVCPQ